MKTIPALLSLIFVLAACGASTSTPTAAQTVSGTISALSADHQTLTVSGQTLRLGLAAQSLSSEGLQTRSSGAKVRVNGDAANELALSVGQHVTVHRSGDVASEVDIQKELRGVIERIGPGSVVVAGQTVEVTASTRLELSREDSSVAAPRHTLADLKVGTFAEVSGGRDTTGTLVASSIEVRTQTERHEQGESDESELRGVVSGLNAATTTFTVLGTSVQYRGVTVSGTLADGSTVEAKGSFDTATKLLTATRVRVESADAAGTSEDGAPDDGGHGHKG